MYVAPLGLEHRSLCPYYKHIAPIGVLEIGVVSVKVH